MAYTPSDIVSVLPGTYTPGAETALHNACSLINASWNQANIKEDAYATKIEAIDDWMPVPGTQDITAGTATSATIVEPAVTIPESVAVDDVMTLFDTKYLELVSLLSEKFVDFRASFFPDENKAYLTAENWLQAAMADDSGLPAAVRAQLMTDATNALVADASRATDTVLQTFAARRFPLPPGAAAGATLQIQQKVQDGVAEAGRKIMTMSVEQFRFNVTQLLELRKIAMDSAVKYIMALASGPDMASKLVNTGYDAQSKLISAASQFYSVRADVAKVSNQVSQFNVSTELEAQMKNQVADLTLIEDKVKVLLTEAQTLGQMATAMFNNLHASAGTGYNISVS